MRLRLLTAPILGFLLAGVWAAGAPASPPAMAEIHVTPQPWLVVLDGAPARAQARDTVIARQQHTLTPKIEAEGGLVLDGYRAALNAMLVQAPADRIPAIASLPGVRGVWRAPLVKADSGLAPASMRQAELQTMLRAAIDEAQTAAASERDDNRNGDDGPSAPVVTSSSDATAQALAQDPAQSPLDGTDTIVAVAGSGIDYLHTALGGAGDSEAFAANDPNVIEADSFPTTRVVGGYDLAGPIYSAACPDPVPADELCSSTPMPDMDPIDAAGGLGTALAGIVAGDAPGARFVALDIFGSTQGVAATSALHVGAIDWAVRHNSGLAVPGTAPDDRIDVLLLQAGAAWGGGMPLLDEAVRAASEVGLTVVAPVGDSGDVPFAASGPATARSALAVGAAYGSDDTTWGIRADWTGDTGPESLETEALEAQDPWTTLAATGAISGTLAWYGQACNGDDGMPSLPAQDINEKIALIERGTCAFSDKVSNAESFGAVAALLFTDQRGKTRPRGGTPPGIPSLMIDRAPGLQLQQLVEEGTLVTVLLDPGYGISLAGLLLPSSGRGPSRAGGLTPDVVADGANVNAPTGGGGDATRTLNGTAPAAARVAGLAVKATQWRDEKNADWSPGLLTAMIAQSAEPGVRLSGGEPAPVARQGAGLVDVDDEPDVADWVSLTVSSPGRTGPLGLDWRAPRVIDPEGESVSALLKLELADTGARRLLAGFRPRIGHLDTFSGTFLWEVALGEVTGSGEAEMKIDIDPTELPPWMLDDGQAVADEDRLSASTLDGHVVIVETEQQNERIIEDGLRRVIPFQVAPRAGSCAASGIPSTLRIEEPGADAPVRTNNPCAGEGPLVISHLSGVDPAESSTVGGSGSTTPAVPAALDIVAVGLRYGAEPPEDPEAEPDPLAPTWIEIHVQTAARRHLAPEATLDVLLDLDRDGSVDRILTTVYAPNWRGGYGAGDWRVLNTPLIPGTFEPDVTRALPDPPRLVWDLDEAVTVLRFRAEETLIDLESGEEAFDFAVRVRDAYGDHPITVRYPGEDFAPDGAADGEMFGFDQTQHECLRVMAPDGATLDRVGDALVLPAGADTLEHVVQLGASCPADAEYGLLYSFPRDRDVAGRVLPIKVGSDSTVFLPWAGALAE